MGLVAAAMALFNSSSFDRARVLISRLGFCWAKRLAKAGWGWPPINEAIEVGMPASWAILVGNPPGSPPGNPPGLPAPGMLRPLRSPGGSPGSWAAAPAGPPGGMPPAAAEAA